MKRLLTIILLLFTFVTFGQLNQIDVKKAYIRNWLIYQGDTLAIVSISGDTIFVTRGGTLDTLIAGGVNHWDLTGNNIANNNTGKVTIDSLHLYPLPPEANRVGRIPVLQTNGLVEWASPLVVYDTMQRDATTTPTAYSQWVRDSVALTTTIAHSTDTVIIGNTLMFSADKVAIIKTSNGHFIAGAYEGGIGVTNIGIGVDAFKLWTGSGGSNIAMGYQSLYGADSSSGVTAIGSYAAYQSNKLAQTIAMGQSAGQGARGTGNCFLGYNVGGVNLSSDYVEGDYLFGVGYEALAGTDASHVNAFGYDAGWNSDGSYGNYMGKEAGADNDGNYTNFFGENAGAANTGNHVNGIGFWSCQGNSANYVIGIGYEAAKTNTDSAVYILKYNNLNTTALHKGYFITGLNVFPHVQIDSALVVKDSVYFFNKASAFMASDGSDFKIENTPAAGDISIVGYTNSTGVQAFHFDGDAGEIGIGTNAPSNFIDLTGNTDIHGNVSISGDLDMTSDNIDNADTINTGSISFTDPTVWMDSFRKAPFYFSDFLAFGTTSADPWFGIGISSGFTAGTNVNLANHPGAARVITSTTNNSGYMIMTATNSMNGIAPNAITNMIFYTNVLDSVTTRFGFHDATTVTAPVDGAYFEIGPDSVLWGKTMAASSGSTTGTSYTLAVSTWYRLKIVVNSNSTRVDYYVYNSAGTELWTNYLTTNIPTDALAHGVITTKEHTGTGAGIVIINIDYMDLYLGTLVR